MRPSGIQAVAERPRGVRPVTDGPRGVRRAPDLANNAVLVARDLLSPTVARLVVRPDAGMASFEAGQYLALGVRVGDRVVQRPYSTASDPAVADAHEFLVRRVARRRADAAALGAAGRNPRPPGAAEGRLHAQYATTTVRTCSSPRAPASHRSWRCCARSPGAPTRRGRSSSTARPGWTTLSAAPRSRRSRSADLALTYVPTVSRPDDPANARWRGRTGRAETILPSVIASAKLPPGGFVAYLCGNPGMVTAAEVALRDYGAAPGDVRAERYWTSPGS